jgi:retinol dehydrogenase 14
MRNVRRLAHEVLERLSRIDVLIDNVGGYWDTRHVTADGLEQTFALNHLAAFLLTKLLVERSSVGRGERSRADSFQVRVHIGGRGARLPRLLGTA